MTFGDGAKLVGHTEVQGISFAGSTGEGKQTSLAEPTKLMLCTSVKAAWGTLDLQGSGNRSTVTVDQGGTLPLPFSFYSGAARFQRISEGGPNLEGNLHSLGITILDARLVSLPADKLFSFPVELIPLDDI